MGLVLRDPLPWNDALRVVRTAEASGYEAVFVPEIQAREAFSTLTGFGAATERLRLGTGVVTLQSRTPAAHGDGRGDGPRRDRAGGSSWGSARGRAGERPASGPAARRFVRWR